MSQQPEQAPADETPQEWAARVITEHGPPPQAVEDLVRSIAKRQQVATATYPKGHRYP